MLSAYVIISAINICKQLLSTVSNCYTYSNMCNLSNNFYKSWCNTRMGSELSKFYMNVDIFHRAFFGTVTCIVSAILVALWLIVLFKNGNPCYILHKNQCIAYQVAIACTILHTA